MKLAELTKTVQELNNSLAVPDWLYNTTTGLLVVVIVLAMKYFRHTPSSVFKFSPFLYYAGAVSMLIAIGINRWLHYPPVISFSSFLYLMAYLFHSAYIIYAGSRQRRWRAYGNQTISAAPDFKPLN